MHPAHPVALSVLMALLVMASAMPVALATNAYSINRTRRNLLASVGSSLMTFGLLALFALCLAPAINSLLIKSGDSQIQFFGAGAPLASGSKEGFGLPAEFLGIQRSVARTRPVPANDDLRRELEKLGRSVRYCSAVSQQRSVVIVRWLIRVDRREEEGGTQLS
jgi:hypothetical protein